MLKKILKFFGLQKYRPDYENDDTISDFELRRLVAFSEEHKFCRRLPLSGSAGYSLFTIITTRTGIGTGYDIECHGCGKKADVTLMEIW